MTTTYEKILSFLSVATSLRGESKQPLSKFHYAIDRVKARIGQACKDLELRYSERQEDLRIKYASVDDKANVIYKDGIYLFSKENTQTITNESRALMGEKLREVVEIEPYISTSIPDLTMYEIEYLAGFVIPENYEVAIPEN